jgi:hypothetical protein
MFWIPSHLEARFGTNNVVRLLLGHSPILRSARESSRGSTSEGKLPLVAPDRQVPLEPAAANGTGFD